MTYFEVKVRYAQRGEGDTIKRVSAQYLIETLTFADAEQKALEAVQDLAVSGVEVEVAAIKKVQYDELLLDQVGELLGSKALYKAKVMFTTIDDNGKEKQVAYNLLVEDVDVAKAHQTVLNHLKGSMTDFTIDDVVKTKYVDVVLYKAA